MESASLVLEAWSNEPRSSFLSHENFLEVEKLCILKFERKQNQSPVILLLASVVNLALLYFRTLGGKNSFLCQVL